MRLGGPSFGETGTPEGWIAGLRKIGFTAAYCPFGNDADDAKVRVYADAAARAGIVIAETGAWSNPLSPDEAERHKAFATCVNGLTLAERLGARCCVNISGSRGTKWDGPHPDNLTPDTFRMIVEVVRKIIDAVKPIRTFYTLETMPWMYPDSPEHYLALIKAVDRKAFAVHFDPVNLINNPGRYFNNGVLIREFVRMLGPHIRSCHAKDILIQEKPLLHLDEVRPGTGNLDYHALLTAVGNLDPDMPVMLEHLSGEEDYRLAAAHIRTVAAESSVRMV